MIIDFEPMIVIMQMVLFYKLSSPYFRKKDQLYYMAL